MSQKVAILGYGVEGRSAYRYFASQGAAITIFHKERPAGLPDDVRVVIADHVTDLTDFDIVVRSPAVRPDSIHTNGRITTVVKEFMAIVGPERVIGVTGTKGKGTTSTLIHDMLVAAGMRAHLAGNIGLAPLDLLPNLQPDDYVVLELSSFQLWDMDVSPHIAVLLMMEPEHLDVHTDVAEYIAAKSNIATHQQPDDILIYLESNKMTKQAAVAAKGRRISYSQAPGAHVEGESIVIDGQTIAKKSELALLGEHNIDNACAAITAVWQITQDAAAMRQVLGQFKGLPHRLQLVETVNDVGYYDDSIATTPGSAIAALRSFSQPKIIILGGSDKGADFGELAAEIASHADEVRGIVLIGRLQDKIHAALEQAGVQPQKIHPLGSPAMDTIVEAATALSQPGDAVIMSPACASFDMFKNYKDRGDQFVAAVKRLAARG